MNKKVEAEITLSNSQTEEPKIVLSPEEQEEYDKQIKLAKDTFRAIKKRLKLLSKSQLIGVIVEYSDKYREMQNLNKFLYEENNKLKEANND